LTPISVRSERRRRSRRPETPSILAACAGDSAVARRVPSKIGCPHDRTIERPGAVGRYTDGFESFPFGIGQRLVLFMSRIVSLRYRLRGVGERLHQNPPNIRGKPVQMLSQSGSGLRSVLDAFDMEALLPCWGMTLPDVRPVSISPLTETASRACRNGRGF